MALGAFDSYSFLPHSLMLEHPYRTKSSVKPIHTLLERLLTAWHFAPKVPTVDLYVPAAHTAHCPCESLPQSTRSNPAGQAEQDVHEEECFPTKSLYLPEAHAAHSPAEALPQFFRTKPAEHPAHVTQEPLSSNVPSSQSTHFPCVSLAQPLRSCPDWQPAHL